MIRPIAVARGASSARLVDGSSDADAAHEVLTAGLRAAAARLRAEGVPVPALEGKLLRPLTAYALVPRDLRRRLDHRFWSGALAIQMVHEASLLHDDIIDSAAARRGRPTLVTQQGVGPALVLGDHYLTGAYRAALAAESPGFLACFIRAVERTVAGEVEQSRRAGGRLRRAQYDAVVRDKSGALFGAAACLGGAVLELADCDRRVELGCRLGALYQQVDDILDYCPAAGTGKPPMQDYGQGKWTWVMDLTGLRGFDAPAEAVREALFERGEDGSSPARSALCGLRAERDELMAMAEAIAPGDDLLRAVVGGWIGAAERGVARQERVERARPVRPRHPTSSGHDEVVALAKALGDPHAWADYFGRHAKTFRFAARLFPAARARDVTGLYAFCRFTDDLVDAPHDDAGPERIWQRLEAWRALVRAAHGGERTGVPLLDEVIGGAGRAGVDWRYPDALLDGVAMDLEKTRYEDWDELERYTFGVAGAVGGWMTQLFGLRDPALLEQAHALGHGMQLTNILRDVGEDWARGRLYLPRRVLRTHGLADEDIEASVDHDLPLPDGWVDAMEELIARADAYYDAAWPGIRALPGFYRRPVAVAAAAYRGIHGQVRRNGYDNLRRRAHTSLSAKLLLGTTGLLKAVG